MHKEERRGLAAIILVVPVQKMEYKSLISLPNISSATLLMLIKLNFFSVFFKN
jgi:ABC-type multidrug transport system permease subunit